MQDLTVHLYKLSSFQSRVPSAHITWLLAGAACVSGRCEASCVVQICYVIVISFVDPLQWASGLSAFVVDTSRRLQVHLASLLTGDNESRSALEPFYLSHCSNEIKHLSGLEGSFTN